MDGDQGKLFIGGISWETTEEKLREYFQTFGEIREAVIMKDRSTGRARGFGFVIFVDPAVADRVVAEKHTIDGRQVEAKKAVPRDEQQANSRNSNNVIHGSPGGDRSPSHGGLGKTKKIFVGGLASSVTEEDFRRYFEQFGTITDVVVMYDHNTQRPRGFGFITFDSEEAADNVLQKAFHELNDKMVEVKRAVPKELSGPGSSPIASRNYVGRGSPYATYAGGYGGSLYYGGRMDGRYIAAGGRGYSYGYGSYGSGYGSGYGMNGYGGYGSGGYGGSGLGNYLNGYGYGTSMYGAGYGGRSTWSTGGYGSGSGSGYGGSGYGGSPWSSGSGPAGGSPGYSYGSNEGYGSSGNSYSLGGRQTAYGNNGYSNSAGMGSPSYSGYGDMYGSGNYEQGSWGRTPSGDFTAGNNSTSASAGYNMSSSTELSPNSSPAYGGNYNSSKQARAADSRFRPFPVAGDRPT